VLLVTPSTPKPCLKLLRTKDISGGKELARYFGARDTIIRKVVREEDVEIARAVFEYATELEDLQMSTTVYFQKSTSIVSRRFYSRIDYTFLSRYTCAIAQHELLRQST
jgi:hypothetical protein